MANSENCKHINLEGTRKDSIKLFTLLVESFGYKKKYCVHLFYENIKKLRIHIWKFKNEKLNEIIYDIEFKIKNNGK